MSEGFIFETRNREEADLVATMRAQGKSTNEIQTALDNLRISKALNDIGVKLQDVEAFLRGDVVQFQYPTEGGADVFGFIQFKDGRLTSQLFSINNTSGGAPAAFRKFVTGSLDIARSLGLSEVELQGGSVINTDLATALRARGFQPKTVTVPEALGGGTQEVLFKIVPVR